jgi:gas vesicle protein
MNTWLNWIELKGEVLTWHSLSFLFGTLTGAVVPELASLQFQPIFVKKEQKIHLLSFVFGTLVGAVVVPS